MLCLVVLYFGWVMCCTFGSEQVEQTLKETIKCKSSQIVGMSVSVVRSTEVLFVGGYGVTDKESNTAVTGETVFQIASLSKAFASTLLVKLLEEKTKYSVNTKISTILNDEGIFNDSMISEYATVRDLLSHRTGISPHNRMRLDTNLTRSTVLHRLKYLKPKGVFRGSFIYNNLMYGVITHLAELIGGDSWENLIRTHLFNPLGMTDSTFVTEADPGKIPLAKAYVEYYGELHTVPFQFSRRYGDLCGSTCILSTATDMTKWMQFYLNGGKLANGTRLISENAFKLIIKPENVIHKTYTDKFFAKPQFPVTNSQTGYALGWRTGHYRGYQTLIHTGSTYGYRAILAWYPDLNLGIFIAMTGNDANYLYRTSLQNYLFDIFSGHSPYLNSSTICSYPEPWLNQSAPNPKPNYREDLNLSRSREDYFGTFYNPAYGNIVVKEHKERNKLTLVYGYVTFVLYPKSTNDEFVGNSVGTAMYLYNFYTFKFKFEGKKLILEIPEFERTTFYKKPYHSANDASTSNITLLRLASFLVLATYILNI